MIHILKQCENIWFFELLRFARNDRFGVIARPRRGRGNPGVFSLLEYTIIISLALVANAHCHIAKPSQEPLAYEMTADEIECSQESHKCIARKNARVSTGAKDQAKILTAEVITASMQEEGVAPQIIDAEGNVLLQVQGDMVQSIRADKARYEPHSQKAVFKGDVLLRFDSHIFKGDEVTAELDQGNFVLRRSPQAPVSGLIYLDTSSKDRRRI